MNEPSPIVVATGLRTPFVRAGTVFKEWSSYDLAREVLLALGRRDSAVLPDYVILGTVASRVATSNVAREAMLAAGVSAEVPAHTVTQACISANQAISQGVDMIRCGHAETVIAGGTECLSDFPVSVRRELQRRLFAAQTTRGLGKRIGLLRGLRPRHLLPEVPKIAEFSTGRTMGQDCDRLAARFGVDRQAQDEFAIRSHRLAGKAWEEGFYDDMVAGLSAPPDFRAVARDNGIRADAAPQKVASLPPAFVRPFGTVTAANSSYLTDGAAAVVLMPKDRAAEAGLDADVAIRTSVFSGQSPEDALLLGPAHAVARLITARNLKLEDVDVFEFHEAFAGQVLANLRALDSDDYCREQLGLRGAVGEVPIGKLNTRGGSLSLGHPFGATGARLVHTAAKRLREEDGRLALVAACAAGGLGNAMLLERLT